jgi:uncharacterized protein YycO
MADLPFAQKKLQFDAPGGINPGNYGVSHGSGMVGELIRSATQSWAGHAFVYVGGGMIIEAAPPVTRIVSVNAHPDAIWNNEEPLTDDVRKLIVGREHALLGTPYDYPAYIGFAMECLHIRNGTQMDPFFQHDKWRVCSADVADAYLFGGIDVTKGLTIPNLVSPADLYNRIASRTWGHA